MSYRAIKCFCSLILMVGLTSTSHAKPAVSTDPILGEWQTFDDKTQAKRTIVRMAYNPKSKTYYGRIIKRFKNIPGMTQSDTCVDCPKPFTDKPITGMIVLWNLKKEVSRGSIQYKGGHAIDPESGKMYRVNAKVSRSGKTLIGTGYIDGLPMLKRKQRWIKNIK